MHHDVFNPTIPERNIPEDFVFVKQRNSPMPFVLLGWILQGYAILAIDMPGQSGESSDTMGYPKGHVPGYLTLGISDPARYYYRGAYVDAVRAVEFLAARPEVDRRRLFVTGSSQGGGLTIATTALIDLLKARAESTPPSVPF